MYNVCTRLVVINNFCNLIHPKIVQVSQKITSDFFLNQFFDQFYPWAQGDGKTFLWIKFGRCSNS